jgi:hypothetical protein
MQIGIFLWPLPAWNKNDWPLVMQYTSWQEIENGIFNLFFLTSKVVRIHKCVIKWGSIRIYFVACLQLREPVRHYFILSWFLFKEALCRGKLPLLRNVGCWQNVEINSKDSCHTLFLKQQENILSESHCIQRISIQRVADC